MRYQNLWLCAGCAAANYRQFMQPAVAAGVSRVLCAGCREVFQRHQCSHQPAYGTSLLANEPLWLKVLETGVPGLCPWCGPVYGVAKRVATSSVLSPQVRDAAALVCVALLVGVGASIVGDLLSS